MNLVQRIEKWGDAHHPKWIDFIRITLGLVLVMKGFQYINNMTELTNTIGKAAIINTFSVSFASHYVVFAHLIGGALIICGLLTRFACVIQIPILLGAIIFVNIAGGLFQAQSELWFSVLILILLVFFTVEGSGPISVDEWMKTHNDERPHKHKWG